MNIMCHCTLIWCLVIIVIKGNAIPNDREEFKAAGTEVISPKQEEEWDEDPYRWDEEIEIVNPSSLLASANTSVDSPHFEPLIAAIDFGRADFDGENNNLDSGRKRDDAIKRKRPTSYGNKISSSKSQNSNRRRKIQRDRATSNRSRKDSSGTKNKQTVDTTKKLKTKSDKDLDNNNREGNITTILKWSKQGVKDINTNHLERTDIKNEDHLKNHRLDAYDPIQNSKYTSKFDEWPDIYNMFPDIETSGIDPGVFVDPFIYGEVDGEEETDYPEYPSSNERIDYDYLANDFANDYTYDYKDYEFEKIDQPSINSIPGHSKTNQKIGINFTPNNARDFIEDSANNNKKFIPSEQLDPFFIPSRKIPFNADKNFLSQAIEYTEKPKSEADFNPWRGKLSLPYPADFSSTSLPSSFFTPQISNSISNQNFDNPIRQKKNTLTRPRFPLNQLYTTTPSPPVGATVKISSSTGRYRENHNHNNIDYIVSTNHQTFPSKRPPRHQRHKNRPIQSAIRQTLIPPPPLPPLRPRTTNKKTVNFKRGFKKLNKKLKSLIKSIKIKRRRNQNWQARLRQSLRRDGGRRRRKLVKSDSQPDSISPYLSPPGRRHEDSVNIVTPKRQRKIRRKHPVSQRRMDDESRQSTKPRSLAHKILDGLNRAARFSSEIMLYASLIGLT